MGQTESIPPAPAAGRTVTTGDGHQNDQAHSQANPGTPPPTDGYLHLNGGYRGGSLPTTDPVDGNYTANNSNGGAKERRPSRKRSSVFGSGRGYRVPSRGSIRRGSRPGSSASGRQSLHGRRTPSLTPSSGRLPSTQLQRQRRPSTGTSSSVGSHLPVIRLTDCSDVETDVDFDPQQLNGHESEHANRTSTPKATLPGDMEPDVSKYESSSSVSGFRRKSSASSRQKTSSKTRRKSGTSIASSEYTSSNKSSPKGGKQDRKGSTHQRLKRGLFGKNDPKSDAANKWKNIVNEFEEVYNEDHQEGVGGVEPVSKEVRRVSKLANLEQYDNVRQVFNRSMPLPMQTAPPGARAQDLEAEAEASETSAYRWNLMTPMGGKTQQVEGGHGQLPQMVQSGESSASSSAQFGMTAVESAISSTAGVGAAAAAAGAVGAATSQTRKSFQAGASASSNSAHHAVASSSHASSSQEASATRERSSSQSASMIDSRPSSRSEYREEISSSEMRGSRPSSRSEYREQISSSEMRGSRPSSRSEYREQISSSQMMGSRPSSRSSSRQEFRSRSASRSGSRSQQSMSAASHSGMQQQHQSSASSAKRKQSSSAHSSSAQSSGKHSSVLSESKHTLEQLVKTGGGKAAMLAAERRAKAMKGVKFKHTRLDKQAAIIVDDVIQNALRLLYGDRKKSFHSSSSAHSSSRHSASSSARKSSSHVEKRIERHVEQHVHHKSAQQKQSKKAAITKKEHRSQSVRPVPSSGHLGHQQRTGSMRPASGKRSSQQGEMAGLYDMVIQPHGEDVKSEAEMEWYRRAKEGPPKPRDTADTNTTTSIKVYHQDVQSGRPPAVPAYQEKDESSTYRRNVVDPPTITRGTVTRVFHELDQQYGQMPASMLLAQLQSLPGHVPDRSGLHQSGEYTNSLEYDYNTWPPSGYLVPPEVRTVEEPELPGSVHYNTLQSGLVNYSGPQSILLGNVPGGYIDDTIVLSPPQPQSPVQQDATYTMTSFKSHGDDTRHQLPHVDVRADTGQLLRSLPIMLPHNNSYDSANRFDESFYSLPAVLESGDFHSGTYSNEPLIVADVLDKVEPEPHSKSFYSLDNSPHVNMNRNQVLNFYVFNQKGQKEPRPRGEEVQEKEIYFGDEDMKKMVSQAVQVYQPSEPEMPENRKYTIYHKQTQTLLPERSSPPPKARTPPRRIERKQERIIKRMAPKPPSPERQTPPVVHRETHHYITKERQIEKLPPPPVSKAEFSVQTDMTGRDWEDEMDSLHHALTEAERRAIEAERVMEEMHASNAAIQSVVQEIEDVAHEQEKLPSPPPAIKEIPVSMEVVKVTPEPQVESDAEDEEFYEWSEVEEREQRLSMAIFEEIEFNLQRTQGGKTSTESGKTSELIPWAVPKYEAVVDRRKQKMTQVRDIHREGDDILVQAGNIPTLNQRLPEQKLMADIEKLEFEPASAVVEQRDVTTKRETNVTVHPSKEEVNIEINRNTQPLVADTTNRSRMERHRTARDYNPRRYYMNTFGHEMDRPLFSPPRARGRTSVRSDTHIPLAAQDAKAKYSTSLLTKAAGLNPADKYRDSAERHSSSVLQDIKYQPGVRRQNDDKNSSGGKHSSTLIHDSLSDGSGGRAIGGTNRRERYLTTYERDPRSTETGQHSTTYITKGSQPADQGNQVKEHHVTTFTHQVKGAGEAADASNSSGYSSADNTSLLKVDRLRGFEIPFGHDESHSTRYLTETDIHLSKPLGAVGEGTVGEQLAKGGSERLRRFVSRFDPGNVYFTVPQWAPVGSSELLLNMTNNSTGDVTGELQRSSLADHDSDSLPDTLPGVEAEHIKRKSLLTKSENQQSPPRVHSEVVEDEEGNLVKVTTTEQKMTKTVDYVSEAEPPKDAAAVIAKQSDEALVEESFVEVDLTTTEQLEELLTDKDEVEEVKSHTEQFPKLLHGAVPEEVVSETSVGYRKIEYDDQEQSMGLGLDEENVDIRENRYLYDMKTTTLKPVKIPDWKSGELLMQYSHGDTMVTEL